VTRPSHFSIFTSMFLKDHGVVSNHERLSADAPTLIDVLKQKAFRTAAFVGAANFSSPGSDFHRRFDDFHACEPRDRRAEDVNADVFPWLLENRNRDFFAWIHYFDTHAPYAPPHPYNRMFQEGEELRGPSQVSPEYNWPELKRNASPGVLEKLYMGEVSYLDAQFGELVEKLRELDIYGSALIVVVADHGDALGELGFWALHSGLSDATTHVPLLIKVPGGSPRGVVRGLVSTLDIYPTIFGFLDLEIPHPHRGENLRPLMVTSRDSERQRVFSEHAHGFQAALRTPRHRAILGLVTHPFDRSSRGYRSEAGRIEVFDYAAGMSERHDIAAYRSDLSSGYRDEIEQFLRDRWAFESTPIENDEYTERLKALGYVR
jgi:arylsulfatase A-like enzyme